MAWLRKQGSEKAGVHSFVHSFTTSGSCAQDLVFRKRLPALQEKPKYQGVGAGTLEAKGLEAILSDLPPAHLVEKVEMRPGRGSGSLLFLRHKGQEMDPPSNLERSTCPRWCETGLRASEGNRGIPHPRGFMEKSQKCLFWKVLQLC